MSNREIVVKGIGKASATPDLLIIEMALESKRMDYEETMLQSAEMIASLRAAIESAGHDGRELKTTSFNINTRYESYRESGGHKQRFAGYVCSHRLKLEFDLDMKKLGLTLGAIARCKAAPDFSIKFSVKDPDAVSEQLLTNAVENAKAKAEILAESAGVKLGAIQRIDYNWGELQLYSKTYMDVLYCAETSGSYDMGIEPEDIDLTDTVTVVWVME